MSNRAVLRTNVLEDKSETYDVLLSDGPDGDNTIEVNCISRRHADDLLAMLEASGFDRKTDIVNRFDAP